MLKQLKQKRTKKDPDELLAEKLYRKRKNEELEKALKDELEPHGDYENSDLRHGNNYLSEG